eukprot:6194132-Pleurochrysis_carterae.AAC.5
MRARIRQHSKRRRSQQPPAQKRAQQSGKKPETAQKNTTLMKKLEVEAVRFTMAGKTHGSDCMR